MMIKPALLLVWPKHIDYPVCRWNLERFKDYFDSIWIAFSEHHREDDLSNFVRSSLPFCNFVDVTRKRDDWRDDAVNSLLDAAGDREYFCFYEQDFLIHDSTFFDKVLSEPRDFIYFKEEDRIHPAFAVVKKELVDKTSKNFAVFPPGDHFYKFFNELPEGVNIDTLGVTKREDYYHMNGLSHNYINFKYGDPFYHPANFLYYNWKSLQFSNQHPLFFQMQEQIERFFGHPKSHIFLDRFFPTI